MSIGTSHDRVPAEAPGDRRGTSPTARAATRWLLALVPPTCLILAATWAFWPILDNGFVAWDDDKNFLANPRYRGLGPANLAWAWTTFHLGVYQPLAWMLFGLEFVLSWLDPRGYHLTSLILHAAVGVMLYALAVRLVRRARPGSSPQAIRFACLLAITLFVVHPLRVEVVAWVSCQGYLTCALFSILAVLAYERSWPPDATGARYTAAALALFCAALLCHATALGLPLVLIALDYYPLRRLDLGPGGRRAVREKWPFFVVAATFCVIGYLAKGSSVKPLEDHGPVQRLAQAGYGIAFYLCQTIAPYGLHAHHPMPGTISPAEPRFLLACLLTVGALLIVLAGARRRPGLAVAWIAYLAILAPNSGLVPFGHQLVADRYSYLATMPLAIGLAGALAGALRDRGRILVLGLASAPLVAGLGILTRAQCDTWHDPISLWTNVLAWDETSSSAHNNLGGLLHQSGRYREALHHFRLAMKHAPRSSWPYINCGMLLAEQGEPAEAQGYFEQALRLDPADPEPRAWLALALSDQGRTEEALAQSRKALRTAPGSARALMALGTTLARSGRLDEAAALLERGRRAEPGLELPLLTQALTLAALGRSAEAEEAFRELLRRNPESGEAHAGLGEVLLQRGDRAGATEHLRQALRIRPDHPTARRSLGRIGGDGGNEPQQGGRHRFAP